MALAAVCEGTAMITENVFEARFMFAQELARLGADLRTDGHHAVVRGVPLLSGAPVVAHDIRAGAALVLAGLAAQGTTTVGRVASTSTAATPASSRSSPPRGRRRAGSTYRTPAPSEPRSSGRPSARHGGRLACPMRDSG